MNPNSKRIAKNTLYLYIRMAVLMVVSLFTSRVVLDKLGVEDFGIYSVVGGLLPNMERICKLSTTGKPVLSDCSFNGNNKE